MAKPKQRHEEAPETPIKNCKVQGCGGTLNEDGFCARGGGYPWYMEAQPHVCPHCREPLHWTGNCVSKKGGCWDRYVKEGPGYRFEEQAGHWVNTGEKQPMWTMREGARKWRELWEGTIHGEAVSLRGEAL